MSKYQEALDRLIEGNYLTNREKKQFANILQELVDKETPKRIELKPKGNVYIDECPNCKEELDTTRYKYTRCKDKINYCYHCGQKLDWSDKDAN